MITKKWDLLTDFSVSNIQVKSGNSLHFTSLVTRELCNLSWYSLLRGDSWYILLFTKYLPSLWFQALEKAAAEETTEDSVEEGVMTESGIKLGENCKNNGCRAVSSCSLLSC